MTIGEGALCPHTGIFTVDTDLVTSGNQSTLTFTDSTWDTEQTVRITTVADEDEDDALCQVEHSGSGGGYDGVSQTRLVISEEFDGGIVGSFEGRTVNLPEGRAGVYAVYLTEEPERGCDRDDHLQVPATPTSVSTRTRTPRATRTR